MEFKDWIKKTGISMHALGKLCGLSTTTIRNLKLGKPITLRTLKKLVRVTKKFPDPITYTMFPKVFFHGENKILSGVQAFKRLLEKEMNHSFVEINSLESTSMDKIR
jgi:transcriptional regulator with XRE-family HTH domain